MRTSPVCLCFVAALAIGAGVEARETEPTADARSIGRYRIERSGSALSIAQPRDRALGLTLLAGGLVVVGLGAGLRGAGRSGAGTGVLLLGLALAGIGVSAVLATERWRANEIELVRERLGGRVDRWPRAAIAEVTITRRERSAEDLKRARIRPWDVTIRGRDGVRLPVRFSVESETDARALAVSLADALVVAVREP